MICSSYICPYDYKPRKEIDWLITANSGKCDPEACVKISRNFLIRSNIAIC